MIGEGELSSRSMTVAERAFIDESTTLETSEPGHDALAEA